MSTSDPVRAKYLFLDVVGFTRARSVEAQTDIVGILNSITRECVEGSGLTPDQRIYLPTGDGICVAIVDEALPYDMHLQLALKLLADIATHNSRTKESSRRFEVRVGLNENVDNLIVDINGARNVAGAGINMAQRVMNAGDGGNILAGQVVYETLSCRERYMNSFRRHRIRVKHDVVIPAYQFIEKGHAGLSIKTPTELRRKRPPRPKLTREEAYYVAHSIKNQEFLLAEVRSGQSTYSATVLLWFLALDSIKIAQASAAEKPSPYVHSDDLLEALKLYNAADFWLVCHLADFVRNRLSNLSGLMEDDHSLFYVATDRARARLKRDHPEVYREFEMSD